MLIEAPANAANPNSLWNKEVFKLDESPMNLRYLAERSKQKYASLSTAALGPVKELDQSPRVPIKKRPVFLSNSPVNEELSQSLPHIQPQKLEKIEKPSSLEKGV